MTATNISSSDLNGSYLDKQNEKEISRKESNYSITSTGSGGRCTRKDRVAEHAENVRRLMEKFPRKSVEEVVALQ